MTRSRRLGTPVGGLASAGDRLWATTLSQPAKHRGGTLRLALDDTLDSVDPATAAYPQSGQILSLTNDGLVAFRRVGGAAGTLLVPDLATAISAPTDGGTTYRFVLRKGIRYTSGQSVRASDVRRSLERALATKQGLASFFLTKLVGAARCRPAHCDLSAGVVADDAAGTVTFHLTSPDPNLPAVLAQPFAFLLPPAVGRPRNDRPVPATGPYRIASVSLGKSLVLERNPRFHVWSTQARPGGVSRADRLAARSRRRPPDRPGGAWRAGHRAREQPLDERAFPRGADPPRQPGARAGARDDERLLHEHQAATIAGFRPYCPYGRGGLPGSGYKGPELEQAQRLVAASGTAGERVTIVAAVDTKALSEYLAGVLDRLGYRARLRVVSSRTYFRYVADSRHRAQMGFYGWVADYPAPADFLDVLFSCRSWKPANPDATVNPSLFCDQRVERALAAARHLQVSDPSRAPLGWARVDRIVTDLAPWAVVWSRRDLYMVSKRVGNYQYNPQWGPLLDQLWVR